MKEELHNRLTYIEELESTMDSYEMALKENKNEIEILEKQLHNKIHTIQEYENNFVNIEDVRQLQDEMEQKSCTIIELQGKLNVAERELEHRSHSQDLQELMEAIESKSKRIAELEDALRESVKIAAEREMVLQQEEQKRRQIMEKVKTAFLKVRLQFKSLFTGIKAGTATSIFASSSSHALSFMSSVHISNDLFGISSF